MKDMIKDDTDRLRHWFSGYAKLLYISWVFDLNFPVSFHETLRGRYLDRLSASLPMSREVRGAVQRARDHTVRNAARV
jgi:hypothetical protein